MNLGMNNFLLILSVETIAACLFAMAILVLKNRKLRRGLTKLQGKIKDLRKQAAKTQAPAAAAPTEPKISYSQYLDEQIEHTKAHHHELGSRQDIALDLDPDAPLTRRVAAIRHAVLIAEKEATANLEQINWDFLTSRYQQLLSYTEDYAKPLESPSQEPEQSHEELLQARKRISNLERFKTLYFELEERWEKCKGEATECYSELKTLVEQADNADDFTTTLENYRSVYNEVEQLIEKGTNASVASNEKDDDSDKHHLELQQLRSVASDQHKIITELKEQLENAETSEEAVAAIENLQTELHKQARFLQESETCIQLMEDELEAANRELIALRNKTDQLPELEFIIQELTNCAQSSDQMVDALKEENRQLAKKLELAQEAPPEGNDEIGALRTELSTAEAKYNELEEKFLNLKQQG